MTSSSSFDRYHEEFNLMIQQMMIQKSSKDAGTVVANDDDDETASQQQCNNLIKQMSLEARSAGDADQKQQMLDLVKECKAQYQYVVQQSERQGLLACGTSSSSNTSGEGGGSSAATFLQRNEVAMATQNATLERAHRTIQETEQVAINITQELDKNRETISRTQDRIHEVSSLTSLATSILNRLKK